MIYALGESYEMSPEDIANKVFKTPWQYCTVDGDLLTDQNTGKIIPDKKCSSHHLNKYRFYTIPDLALGTVRGIKSIEEQYDKTKKSTEYYQLIDYIVNTLTVLPGVLIAVVIILLLI